MGVKIPIMTNEKPTPQKVIDLMMQLDVSRVTLAELLQITDTTVDAWVDGKRDPLGPAMILIDLLLERPELELLLFARYTQKHGVPPKKKGHHRGGRRRQAPDSER
jgi:hypothetical protein